MNDEFLDQAEDGFRALLEEWDEFTDRLAGNPPTDTSSARGGTPGSG